ncbi:hypothetical protein TWF506_004374 [Arthrobotrys conoides]|uniref:Uncharacterized protein n=1 Tax=Arthrobotrys conoides TaxID=74498 RepID=A0AAN8NBM1_9PEZI
MASGCFRDMCVEAEIDETGAKPLAYGMSLEAFQIISAWVYGYGEDSLKSRTNGEIIGSFLIRLEEFRMTEYKEMEELRVALLKHLFWLELNATASTSGAKTPKTKSEFLDYVYGLSLYHDREMLADLVKKSIPNPPF